MKRQTEEWIKKAEGDRRVALREMRAEEPVYDAVCFHAQQCIEKYLKALLEENRVPFPKTHDLVALMGLCLPHLAELKAEKKALAALTAFSVASRYPGEEVTEEDAEECVGHMKKLRVLLRKALGME